tara:strand:+ start:163 stop:663 length:501 start_codon:yes stop_codon:yes gene_type:complete
VNDSQLIWEAYLQESYFDSWQLPDGCEDWRVKYKNEVGQMALDPLTVHDLILKGCKPMGSFDSKEDAKLIASLQQNGMHIEVSGDLMIIGPDPEWVKRGAQAHGEQDHVEFGKALGFGDHSIDIGTPEVQARAQQFHQKKSEDYKKEVAAQVDREKNFDHSSVPEL